MKLKRLLNFISLILILTITSCKEERLICNSEEFPVSDFVQGYITNSQVEDKMWMDTKTHELKFKMNVNGNLCSIGYQENGLITGDLTIEVLNEDEEILFAEILEFDTIQTEYIEIPTIEIEKNKTYTLRRKIENYEYVDETVGRILIANQTFGNDPLNLFDLPKTIGKLTIVETDFYKNTSNGLSKNRFIPFIDFGFKEN